MNGGQRRLGALLLEMAVITEEQLEQALEEQRRSGRRLGRVLVDAGVVEERPLVEALSRQLGLERWHLEKMPSEPLARALLPRDLAIRARALPLLRRFEDERDTVFMATSDPLAPMAGKVVRSMSERGALVRWLLAGESELELAIVQAYEGVAVIQGRPEEAGPPPTAKPIQAPTGVEAGLIEALDAALGAAEGHHVVEPAPPTPESGAIPALTVGTSVRSGHTLVADDAVLEIVEVAPGEVSSLPEVPDLGLEPLVAEKTKESDISRARAKASKSPRTSWSDLVPVKIEAESNTERNVEALPPAPAPTPPTMAASPSRADSVALARVAIRRSSKGGVKEVVSPELRARDPRESTGVDRVESTGPLTEVSLSTPAPLTEPEGSPVSPRPPELEVAHRSPTPELELVEPEAATDDVRSEAGEEDDGGFSDQPTHFSIAAVHHQPLSGPDLPIEAPSELEEVLAGPPPPRLDEPRHAASANLGPDPEGVERAAELHARLVRFIAGESLSESAREEVLRVVVKVLLERGFMDEKALAILLSED